MNFRSCLLLAVLAGLAVMTACGIPGASGAPNLELPIAPIALTDDLTSIDLCQAIPQENMEAVMGVGLVEAPSRITYRNAADTSGCFFRGPTDSDRELHFGYVVLTPIEVYESQTLKNEVDVTGIGQAAYFTTSSDARQLWVKVNDQVAFVVAFGDVAKEEGAKAIAGLMMDALQP